MIYIDLFIGFLKVGLFAFGGAYGAIPLIRDVVLSYRWIGDEMLTYMIAVSESTPGPIMVNLATYVGSSQESFWGALIATTAVVLPAEEPVCSGYATRAEAMHHWHHTCHWRFYDPGALCWRNQRFFDRHDGNVHDCCSQCGLLRFKKGHEKRHFTNWVYWNFGISRHTGLWLEMR